MNLINPQHKILYHLDRVLEWKNSGSTRPILFEIDPSNVCNHNCPWCSFSSLRAESKDMLCFDMAKKILNGLEKLGVKAINWTGGGEPLVNPRIVEMIEYAKQCGMDQGMFTNGYLLNDKNMEHVIKKLDWLRVSVDAFDGDSYHIEHGTPASSFDKVIDNMRKAVKVQDRCTIGYGFIMTENNWNGVEQAIILAKDIGVDYIQIKPVSYRPGNKQISTDLVNEMHKLAKSLTHFSDDNFDVIVADYRFEDMKMEDRGRKYTKCMSHCFQGAIGADGKVYFCDHHKGEKDYEIGDINECKDHWSTSDVIEKIWNGDKRKKVIDFVNSTDLSQCQDCCRNHELNKFLWNTVNKSKHPNHI